MLILMLHRLCNCCPAYVLPPGLISRRKFEIHRCCVSKLSIVRCFSSIGTLKVVVEEQLVGNKLHSKSEVYNNVIKAAASIVTAAAAC